MPAPNDSAASQDGRIGKLTTPLGQDKLLLHRFDGSEGLSELFEYRVEALSSDMDIDFTAAIGKSCTVSLSSYGATRHFNGILTEAQWIGARQEKYAYRLTLRPWLWLLGRTAKCRLFKDMDLDAILNKVFQDNGFSDYKLSIQHKTEQFESIAQYRETDLAFVSRLCEEYGVYSFHEHGADKHVLNLIDATSAHPAVAGLPYMPLSGQDRRDKEHIYEWRAERRFRTGRFELRDYDYMQATRRTLTADKQGTESYEKSMLEAYDFPGRWTKDAEGKHLAQVRLEAEQALDYRKLASGDAISLFPGASFSLSGHPADNGGYFVVRANHAFVAEDYRSGGGGRAEEVYHGQYELQENARPFRAPPVTPRPRIYGPQTAFVVTKAKGSSEEIDVDKDGRIYVNFHWNRDDPNDFCSRPVRVAQIWAGKQWGWQFFPRVGMEVVVEFLEGDPDQPLVTGCVYNSDYTYPNTLPDKKNISGIKSDSTLGHGGYNELTFDDTKSSEVVQFRAEKDLNANIRNIETRKVAESYKGGNKSPSRSTEIVKGADKLKITDGDWIVDVTGAISIKATEKIEIEVGASKITMTPSSVTVKSGDITIDGTSTVVVKGGTILLN